MAWIQVDAGIKEHDKIYNLADTLGITDAHAVGLMVCLWTWAATAAPEGDITDYPIRAIARAAGWEEAPQKFYEALQSPKCKFVEEIDGRLALRNWQDRAAMLIDTIERMREKNRDRVRRFRLKRTVEKTDIVTNAANPVVPSITKNQTPMQAAPDDVTLHVTLHETDVTLPCNVTETLHVTHVTPLPNQTINNQDIYPPPSPPLKPGGEGEGEIFSVENQDGHQTTQITNNSSVSDDLLDTIRDNDKGAGFDEFWEAYPRKEGMAAARRAWSRAGPDAALRVKIIAAIANAKTSGQWARDNGRYIPAPAKWLSDGHWDDTYLEAAEAGVQNRPRPPNRPKNWKFTQSGFTQRDYSGAELDAFTSSDFGRGH